MNGEKVVVKPVEDEISIVNTIDVNNNGEWSLHELGQRNLELVKGLDRNTLEKYTWAQYTNRCLREEVRFIRNTMKSTTILTDYLMSIAREYDEEIYRDIKSLEITSSKYTIMSEIISYCREKANNYFESGNFNKFMKYRDFANMLNELLQSFNIDKKLIIKKFQSNIKINNKYIRDMEDSFDEQTGYKSGAVYVNDRDNLLNDSISEYLSEVSQYIAKEKYSTQKITNYITELSNMLQSSEIPAEYKPRISQLISKLATALTTINSEKE